MKIVDKVFGEIEYSGSWFKDIKVSFMGKNYDVQVSIYGEDDGIFEEGQYKAYEELWKKWDSFQEEILAVLYDYYVEEKNSMVWVKNKDIQIYREKRNYCR